MIVTVEGTKLYYSLIYIIIIIIMYRILGVVGVNNILAIVFCHP